MPDLEKLVNCEGCGASITQDTYDTSDGQCPECYNGPDVPDETETMIQEQTAAGRTVRTVDTEKLDGMLKRQSLYISIYPGDGFQYRNCLIAVIRVTYPFMVLEIADTTDGNAPNVTLENTICFKNAYLKVIKRKGNYLIVEFIGVKKGVAKAIHRAERIMEKKKWNKRMKDRKYRR